uniref:Retrotransposon protein, putative, LINE subclass n=1 Tax=Oryza sativa subsp. japonica TaxID=39947 RepID=Q2QUQ0_ORYSJ|nr:retrotransposon protein, putative, LINE subclass [Oryza sativa Japonica Group]
MATERFRNNAISTLQDSNVLLNGVPGKFFKCKRGVRQSDPLSPLLFALGADHLQAIINKAHQRGLLAMPIPAYTDVNFPVVQYTNDTLIFLEASATQLFVLKALLNSFALSSGLKANFGEFSFVFPSNILYVYSVSAIICYRLDRQSQKALFVERGIAKHVLGSGKDILFWEDMWENGALIQISKIVLLC